MKKVIIFLAIFAFGNETEEILKMMDILKHQNFKYTPITKIYNPFTKTQVIKKHKINITIAPIKTHNYKLEVVFQNKAKINGNWYKNGDKIDSYTVVIKDTQVYLINKNKTIKLNQKTLIKVK